MAVMNDPIEIKKSEMEVYVIEWNSHMNYLYLTLKVVRLFRKKGGFIKKKYKNMITLPGIDQTLPSTLQQGQLRESRRAWSEIKKTIDAALQNMPKEKVEF